MRERENKTSINELDASQTIKHLWDHLCLCGSTSQEHVKTIQSDLTDNISGSILSVSHIFHCYKTNGNGLVYRISFL